MAFATYEYPTIDVPKNDPTWVWQSTVDWGKVTDALVAIARGLDAVAAAIQAHVPAVPQTAAPDATRVSEPDFWLDDFLCEMAGTNSTRIYNALTKAGIKTLSQLQALSRNDLLKLKNIGKRCVKEITDQLDAKAQAG